MGKKKGSSNKKSTNGDTGNSGNSSGSGGVGSLIGVKKKKKDLKKGASCEGGEEEEKKSLLNKENEEEGAEGEGDGEGGVYENIDVGDKNKKEKSQKTYGVKSYLHNFYEKVNFREGKDKTEEDPSFIDDPKRKKTCFGPIWYKIGLSIGVTLVLLGAIAIVIGFTIPKQDTVRGKSEDSSYLIIDSIAVRFNKNLAVCKLIGLAGFCMGGVVIVLTLLIPTLSNSYWEEGSEGVLSAKNFLLLLHPEQMNLVDEYEEMDEVTTPKPTQKQSPTPIPVTEKIKCIQPNLE